MRSLITGASGFAGAYLVRELAAAGHEVIATDLVAPSGLPEGIVYRRCDLLDGGAVRTLVADVRPDYLFHLAAQSSAARSFEEPRPTLETNVFGTLNVLESVRALHRACPGAKTRSGKVRVLSVGSSEEYGRRPRSAMPLGEGSPIEPVSPYAVSKAAQTMLALQYERSFDLDVVATRSFGHTGPGQDVRFVLPAFARQCAEIRTGKREPVVKVGNLDVVRDFLDVRDVVRAYRSIAEEANEPGVYNVCSGSGLDLRDALDFLVRACGVPVRIKEDPRLVRPADIPVLVGDNTRLRLSCGWKQEHSTEAMLGALFEYWERIARET
ncbi:MAG: GDP-mannose 4,6-dehydratase [Candidatus Krumholzibacteria bacterium]|nr:GDP-mannose 4,6-dehydratase [Candidatus Krumholzibacteria bacterium]